MPDLRAVNGIFTPLPFQGKHSSSATRVALLAMTLALALRALFQPFWADRWDTSASRRRPSLPPGIAGYGRRFYLPFSVCSFRESAFRFRLHHLLGPLTERAALAVERAVFLAFCVAIIAIGESGRNAMLRLGHVHEALQRSREHLKFRVRERTAQLQQSNRNLRDLSVRLLHVQDDERTSHRRATCMTAPARRSRRSSSDLAGIERELAARDPQTARRLASIIDDARQISDDLRTISYLLHPPLLDELGLGSALRWYADGFKKRSGIEIHLDLSAKERLAPEMETALFRVVQECLINIHRHSGSAATSIQLFGKTAGRIVLEVEDEGCGITPRRVLEDCLSVWRSASECAGCVSAFAISPASWKFFLRQRARR